MSRSQATGAAGELVAQASLLLRGWVAGNVNSGGRRNSDGQVGRRMGIRLGQIQPQRSRAKMRQFSARASTPRGSREKQPCYHLRCSRSVASAAIRINPTTPRVMAASRSGNAVPRQMSALGQKRTHAVQQRMSALPSKAEMCSALPHVCFGPKADIGARPSNIRCRVEVRILFVRLPQATDGSSGPAGKECCIDARP